MIVALLAGRQCATTAAMEELATLLPLPSFPFTPCSQPPSAADMFAAGVTLACNVLWDNREALLSDLASGTLGAAWDPAREAPPPLRPPPEAVTRELASRLQPRPGLAEELRQVRKE